MFDQAANARRLREADEKLRRDLEAGAFSALPPMRPRVQRAAAHPPGPRAAPAPAPEPHNVDLAAAAICHLCAAAGRPEAAAGYIASGLSVAETKQALAVDSWLGPLAAAQRAN